jgi:hypothetical protein
MDQGGSTTSTTTPSISPYLMALVGATVPGARAMNAYQSYYQIQALQEREARLREESDRQNAVRLQIEKELGAPVEVVTARLAMEQSKRRGEEARRVAEEAGREAGGRQAITESQAPHRFRTGLNEPYSEALYADMPRASGAVAPPPPVADRAVPEPAPFNETPPDDTHVVDPEGPDLGVRRADRWGDAPLTAADWETEYGRDEPRDPTVSLGLDQRGRGPQAPAAGPQVALPPPLPVAPVASGPRLRDVPAESGGPGETTAQPTFDTIRERLLRRPEAETASVRNYLGALASGTADRRLDLAESKSHAAANAEAALQARINQVEQAIEEAGVDENTPEGHAAAGRLYRKAGLGAYWNKVKNDATARDAMRRAAQETAYTKEVERIQADPAFQALSKSHPELAAAVINSPTPGKAWATQAAQLQVQASALLRAREFIKGAKERTDAIIAQTHTIADISRVDAIINAEITNLDDPEQQVALVQLQIRRLERQMATMRQRAIGALPGSPPAPVAAPPGAPPPAATPPTAVTPPPSSAAGASARDRVLSIIGTGP